MKSEEVYTEAAKRLGVPIERVKRMYVLYWRAVKNHIQSLPLKEDLSEEEFSQLKTSINIPSLGKLYCTYDRYKRIHQKYSIYERYNIEED